MNYIISDEPYIDSANAIENPFTSDSATPADAVRDYWGGDIDMPIKLISKSIDYGRGGPGKSDGSGNGAACFDGWLWVWQENGNFAGIYTAIGIG